MFRWFITVFLFSTVCGCADKGILISAEKESYGPPTGGGMLFFVPLRNNSVTNGDDSFTVKIPESFRNKEVVYGDTYFGGGQGAKTGRSVFILAHSIMEKSPVIVFDVNGNADFTDDSIFSIEREKPFDVVYRNYKDKRAIAIERFWLKDSLHPSLKVLVNMDSARKGQKPLSYYLQDRRIYYKRVALPDSNIVTLFDWDFNGFYNDKKDRAIAGDLLKDTFSLLEKNPVFAKSATGGDDLIFPNNTYKLIKVNKYGESISVRPLNKVMPQWEKLPAFTYKDANDKRFSFTIDTSKQLSVLYFWGSWCVGCRLQSPELVKMMDSIPSVSYQSFNYGDRKENMLHYIEHKKMPFKAHWVDEETTKALFVVAYPTFIILDKKGDVLLRTSMVYEVKQYLLKNLSK